MYAAYEDMQGLGFRDLGFGIEYGLKDKRHKQILGTWSPT